MPAILPLSHVYNDVFHLVRIESKEMRFFDKMMDINLLIIEDFGMKALEEQQLI